jgi:thioredoxin
MLSRRAVLIFAAAASTFALDAALAASPKPFDADAFAEAQKAGRPVLLSVHAPWCPICKAQDPILGELTNDPKFKDLAYFTIDFDSQKDLLKRFGVRMQSTLIAFKGEKETGRSVGESKRTALTALLGKTL